MIYQAGRLQLTYEWLPDGNIIHTCRSSHELAAMMRYYITPDIIACKEYGYIVYLNSRMRVTGVMQLSHGSRRQTTMDIVQIIAGAVLTNCTMAALIHNHPSGNCNPSIEDVKCTEKIALTLEQFDVTLVDHIILCEDNKHYSFADEGRMKVVNELPEELFVGYGLNDDTIS